MFLSFCLVFSFFLFPDTLIHVATRDENMMYTHTLESEWSSRPFSAVSLPASVMLITGAKDGKTHKTK